MKKLITFAIVILLGYLSSLAQAPCGTDELHIQNLSSNADYKAAFEKNQQSIEKYVKSAYQQSSVVYTIPIVVHIIHLGEPVGTGTNISDAQVLEAIDGLNKRYSNQIGNGLDMGIQFCLASRDPNGFATNGIVRVDGSSIINYAAQGIDGLGCGVGANYTQVLDLSKWPVLDYYNVWVVNKVCNGSWAAYSSFPSGLPYDGSVIEVTSMTAASPVTAHELAHGFSVHHTFNGETSTSCPANNNCLTDGDRVCDTPPHRKSECSLASICGNNGIWDNSRYNYMSYCGYSASQGKFTDGQKQRMLACLAVYPRINLLSSLGCSVPVCFSPVNISANPSNKVCAGTSVTFTASASNAIAPQYQWSVNGNIVGTNTGTLTLSSCSNGDNITCTLTSGTCVNTSAPVKMVVKSSQPGTPSAPVQSDPKGNICANYRPTYTVTPASVVGGEPDGYSWSITPTTALGVSIVVNGQLKGMNYRGPESNIQLDFNSSFNSSSVTLNVSAYNGCGSSLNSFLIIKKGVPPAPIAITGSTKACRGDNQYYSVPLIQGISNYNWTITPTDNGATYITGNGSNHVSVHFANFTTSYVLSVKEMNGCGTSAAKNLTVALNTAVPVKPIFSMSQSSYVCPTESRTVSVTPISNVLKYTWSIPASVTGVTLTGGGTTYEGVSATSINILFGSTFTASSVTLSCTYQNNCGTSNTATLIFYNNIPAKPALTITPVNTNTSTATNKACSGDKFNLVVTNAPVSSFTNYHWSCSNSGASLIVNGVKKSFPYVGSETSLDLVFDNYISSSQTCTITVYGTDGCSEAYPSPSYSFSFNPNVPGTIGAFMSSTSSPIYNECGSLLNQSYNFGSASAATSYSWSLNNSSGNLQNVLTSTPTAILNLNLSSATQSIVLTGKAKNNCGISSTIRTLTIYSKPTTPAAITPMSDETPCPSASSPTYFYHTNGSAGATQYTWTITGGTKVNQVDDATGSSVELKWNNGITTGKLTVSAKNSCATSSAVSSTLTFCIGNAHSGNAVQRAGKIFPELPLKWE